MKKLMLCALSVMTVVSMTACGGNKKHQEKQLPVTDENITGSWELTHFAQEEHVVSVSEEDERRHYIISEGEIMTIGHENGDSIDAILKYIIEDGKIITIAEKSGGVETDMPDYKVVKLTKTTMRLRTIDSEDGNVDLVLTKITDDQAKLNADEAAAASIAASNAALAEYEASEAKAKKDSKKDN